MGGSGRRPLTERPPPRWSGPVLALGQTTHTAAQGSATGDAGRCWPAPRPSDARSRSAADLYALGQWSVAWSHLARSSRSVGPWALAWLDHASGSSVQCWLTLCGAQLAAACSRQGEEAVASLRPCITSLDLRWIGPGGGCCNNRQHLLGHRYVRACVDYRVK